MKNTLPIIGLLMASMLVSQSASAMGRIRPPAEPEQPTEFRCEIVIDETAGYSTVGEYFGVVQNHGECQNLYNETIVRVCAERQNFPFSASIYTFERYLDGSYVPGAETFVDSPAGTCIDGGVYY